MERTERDLENEILTGLFSGFPAICFLVWGYSSVGRAPALQAGGQEFESPYLHQVAFCDSKKSSTVP